MMSVREFLKLLGRPLFYSVYLRQTDLHCSIYWAACAYPEKYYGIDFRKIAGGNKVRSCIV